MTSEERKAARYQRRRAFRAERRINAKPGPDNYERKCRRSGGHCNTLPRKYVKTERWRRRVASCDDFEQVFSHTNLWKAYWKCRKGKRWKAATQYYTMHAPAEIADAHNRLMAGVYRSGPLNCFTTRERGKERAIKAQRFRDRVVSSCLYEQAIVPGMCRSFIYDNGACLENKGFDFAINRTVAHLRQIQREEGTDGYMLLFDFLSFYDEVSHKTVARSLRRCFTDQRIIGLTERLISMYGKRGLGLGSPVCQGLALDSANELDHMIKEQLDAKIRKEFGDGIGKVGKYYARYMDDGRLYHKSKAVLQRCRELIQEKCAELGITLNKLKTHIVKVKRFTWLKAKFRINKHGQVIMKLGRRSITHMRHKLKKLRKKVDSGKMPERGVYDVLQSWCGHARRFNAWHAIKSMVKLYCSLYSYRPPRGIRIKCKRWYITAA